ncbi:hypothetical protein K0T92_01320 [Paenibacillus oenotherae]|uniref:Uncharacterized protein n=1 Tax=Paenibacillus oenotherae TaxID=1435645 RepID=A0ABS7D0C4_9BACL|nr:hypothetical protein [Paenibacillus oenotherae]MBW7473380.1 hypothetical protein [Paenibacillus oenotherae]
MKIKGKRNYDKHLIYIERSIQEQLNGGVTFKDLFSSEFMKKHTGFNNIESFFEGGCFEATTIEALNRINIQTLDQYVLENSTFATWDKMKDAAGQAYLKMKYRA